MNGFRDYLCVDRFIDTLVDARALATAFELGLVDALIAGGSIARQDLRRLINPGADDRGGDLLLDLLAANHIIDESAGVVHLSAAFTAALEYRELLEAKLDFLGVVAPDMLDHFTDMVVNLPRFLAEARTFQLFNYRRCLEPSRENYAAARRWMRMTTALTRWEASACISAHDFSPYRHLLDVGGNSGEFARRVCAEQAALTATVFDLPLVCEIGREHLRGTVESARINFVAGDALSSEWPAGADIVTFKSMLHDWPDEEAGALLEGAAHALPPGGVVLIFERMPLDLRRRAVTYALLSSLVFNRWFREPDWYRARLEAAGFSGVAVQQIDLETPFMIVSGRRASRTDPRAA